MSSPALALDGLSVVYGRRAALRDVTFVARAGEVAALAGPNGSGKSTLLRASVGLETLASGSVRLGGRILSELSLRGRALRASWMPQEEPPGDNLRVTDYVRYGRFPHVAPLAAESEADAQAVERGLHLAGASELRDRSVWELSGGERQRVRLARVLAQRTPLLLLDEPTAHLDVGHQLDVLDRVRSIARDEHAAVVVALHDLNLAARFADRVVVLHRGRVVADGTPSDVLAPGLLLSVWGIDSELRYDARTRLPYLIPRVPVLATGSPPVAPAASLRVHVLAGGGSGETLFHRLVDAGHAVSAGALPLFDSDTELVEQLRLPAALEVPFAPISEATRAELRALLAASEAIVVAPFPVGPTNLANLEELARFPRPRSVVLIRHAEPRPWDFTGGVASGLRAALVARGATEVANVDEALEALARLPRAGPPPPSAAAEPSPDALR